MTYVTHASVFKYGGNIFLCLLLFPLIVPPFFIIYYVIAAHKDTVRLEGDTVYLESGVFSKKQDEISLLGIRAIEVSQSLNGRIWNYGDIRFAGVGHFQAYFHDVKHPQELKNAMAAYRVKKEDIKAEVLDL